MKKNNISQKSYVKPYRDSYGRYQLRIASIVLLLLISCLLFLYNEIPKDNNFWDSIKNIVFNRWVWIIAAVIILFLFWFFFINPNKKWFNAKKVWNVLGVLLIAAIGLGLWWYGGSYISSLGIRNPFASQAKTVTIPPVTFSSFGALDTDGGENRMTVGTFLGYTIPYADQVAFKGFDFSTKDGEWIKLRFEKFTNRRVWWEVMYTTHGGTTKRKALSPEPYPDAKAGETLVTLISSSGYPAVLYVHKVY